MSPGEKLYGRWRSAVLKFRTASGTGFVREWSSLTSAEQKAWEAVA